jgi:AcrR family transcriptional regulator
MQAAQIPVTPRGQARRTAMIQAAKAVFLEHGYERTTLDMVIDQAGGSRRTLYECFGDKAGLFRAVIELHTHELLEQLQALPSSTDAPEETLKDVARLYLRMLLSPEAIGMYRLLVAEAPKFPELGQAFYLAGPLSIRQHLTQYLISQHRCGTLHVPDATIAARQFVGLIKSDHQLGALLCPPTENCLEQRSEAEIDNEIAQAVRLFINGLQAKPVT